MSIQNVEKWYGENHVVKNMNLEIMEGEFLTLLGPSGCGKTTTLRMIAGFEDATSGIIEVQGERVEEKEPYQRDVNTVFQNYSLFPHMTVYDNVAYGPSIRKMPKDEIKAKVMEMLALVQMSGYEKRKPDALSGGQKQRVAIARALINNPRVLLLDEPLGALDLKLRKQMQIELKRLQKKLGITFVYVTHDQEEAMTMSDRVAVMRNGVILQIGPPLEIYDHPNCRFVADFIGESNVLSGRVTAIDGKRLTVETPDGIFASSFRQKLFQSLSRSFGRSMGVCSPISFISSCSRHTISQSRTSSLTFLRCQSRRWLLMWVSSFASRRRCVFHRRLPGLKRAAFARYRTSRSFSRNRKPG